MREKYFKILKKNGELEGYRGTKRGLLTTEKKIIILAEEEFAEHDTKERGY